MIDESPGPRLRRSIRWTQPDVRPLAVPTVRTSTARWLSAAGEAPLGGDWAEAFAVSADVIALTVGDVSGHGESAAATMQLMRSAVLTAARTNRRPAEILSLANRIACVRNDGIVTAVVGFLNRRRSTLTFALAGHPSPLLVTPDGYLFLAPHVGDLPLGVSAMHSAVEHTIVLPNDALVALYTDGLTENHRDLLGGERELIAACRQAMNGSSPGCARTIAQRILESSRGNDDAAIVTARIVPALPNMFPMRPRPLTGSDCNAIGGCE